MKKVSDFKLAEHIVRLLCRQFSVGFVDVAITFGPNEQSRMENGKMILSEQDRWAKTIYQIVLTYLSNMAIITGATTNVTKEEFTTFSNWALALVRDFSYSTVSFAEALPNRSTSIKLNRDPFIWICLRDLVSPAFEVPIKNVRVIAVKSGKFDGAYVPHSGELPELHGEAILLNLDMENQAARSAHLLFAALQIHGLNPKTAGRDLLSKEELRSLFMGIVKMAFDDRESINTFFTVFSILCEFTGTESLLEHRKTAKWNEQKGLWSQAQYDPSGWWYLGLTEKILEPARGADWSHYYTLKPFTDELYEKIEKEKKRRGLPNLSMEALLRVQSEEYHQRGDLILQGLLADSRVW